MGWGEGAEGGIVAVHSGDQEPQGSWYNSYLSQSLSPRSLQVCQYNFSNPGFSMTTGHFTQVGTVGSVEWVRSEHGV